MNKIKINNTPDIQKIIDNRLEELNKTIHESEEETIRNKLITQGQQKLTNGFKRNKR
jgi:hypothetical protein